MPPPTLHLVAPSAPPRICGVGDHSFLLGRELSRRTRVLVHCGQRDPRPELPGLEVASDFDSRFPWTLGGAADSRQAAIVLGADFGVSWTAVLGHLRTLELIDEGTLERLQGERPTKADYVEGGVRLREDLVPPAVPPRYAQAVVRAFRRHKIAQGRAVELLRGTLSAGDLPGPDRVPPESMRSQFDLD